MLLNRCLATVEASNATNNNKSRATGTANLSFIRSLNLFGRKAMARKQGNPPTTHTIEAGDSLFDIAQTYYGSGNQWSKISAANGNIQPPDLKLGQQA